jgi:hypothetical protein
MLKTFIIVLLLLTAAPLQNISIRPGSAFAQEAWRSDFDDICSRTQDAMTLSNDQLKTLVTRCDAIKPQIEKLTEPQRKVTLKRLQMCRDLYAFVLQSKESQ